MISTYWQEVCDTIKRITETSMDLSAACCLLHLSSFSLTRYKTSLTKHLLNAAKSLIPLYWLSTRVPTVKEWIRKVAEVREMEDTLAQDRGTAEKFLDTWRPWSAFRFSKDFESIMQ